MTTLTGRISRSIVFCVSSWCVRSLRNARPSNISASCSLRCLSQEVPQVHLALPLGPPKNTSVNTLPGLIPHSSSLWFRTLPTNNFSSFFMPQDTTSCPRTQHVDRFPLVQNLPTLMMGPFISRTWNVLQILRPSRSFIGADCSPLCFSLCPLADTRWGYLLGSMAIHSNVSWRAHVFIRTIAHQHVHNIPVFGLTKRFSMPDSLPSCIQSHIIFILHGDGTIPSVGVLGDSRGLAG